MVAAGGFSESRNIEVCPEVPESHRISQGRKEGALQWTSV